MILHLLDNGLNSLNVGIKFYNKYLKDETMYYDVSTNHFGDLKFSVIALHNAVELFSKKLLADVNELLIFQKEILDEPFVLKALNNQNLKKLQYTLIHNDSNFKTIDYSLAIERVKVIFDLTAANKKTLEDLARFRNRLTHFALDKAIEYHEILEVLNETLEIIQVFFIPQINSKQENIKKRDISRIKTIIEKGKVVALSVWKAYFYEHFEEVWDKFDQFLCDDKWQKKYNIAEYCLPDFTSEDEAEGTMYIDFFGDLDSYEIAIKSVPRCDATFFQLKNNGELLGIIDYTQTKYIDGLNSFKLHIFIPKNNMSLDLEKTPNRGFWYNDNNFHKLEFNEHSLMKVMDKCTN